MAHGLLSKEKLLTLSHSQAMVTEPMLCHRAAAAAAAAAEPSETLQRVFHRWSSLRMSLAQKQRTKKNAPQSIFKLGLYQRIRPRARRLKCSIVVYTFHERSAVEEDLRAGWPGWGSKVSLTIESPEMLSYDLGAPKI